MRNNKGISIVSLIITIIVIIIIAHFLNKFKESRSVESIFYGLRPAVAALIAAAGYQVFKVSILALDKFKVTHKLLDLINIKSTILLIILMFAISKFKKHPIVYIVSAAIIGILFKF